MPHSDLYAVIMAGGSGTRFWPASRTARPKQFLPIAGARPMLAETAARMEGLVPFERILVVTAADQAQLVRDCLPELPAENLIAEPVARNTAAAVALGAFEVARRDPRAVQVVLPADHHITPVADFRATLSAGADEVREHGGLLTFGIQPDHPATGYGYIEVGEGLRGKGAHRVSAVSRFFEKPDLERAREFLGSGRFLWNAGIFCWRVDTILEAFARYMPDMHATLSDVAASDPRITEVYPGLESAPVDVAILERSDQVRTMPIAYTWNDVGSWAALPDLSAADSDGNWRRLVEGAELISADSTGCLAYAEEPELIALVGCEDLVVVRSGKTTLVCPRERAQDVKLIVEALRARGSKEFL
ncbi:mannose-1-phosphate guanylyltransferase [Engelhardtia mirabilis]